MFEVAKKLLETNMNAENISNITGLTLKEIEGL